MLERNEVSRNYGNLIASVWEDDSILPALRAEPHKVLNGYGFDIPADAKVNLIVRDLDSNGSPDTQVDLYNKGKETGVYDLVVPLRPEGMDLQDIPLGDDVLELVAGGEAMIAGCCCCCPCCCCSGTELQ